jgi:uridine kinase
MSDPAEVHLVAIVGGSGAGKSWLVERLCQLLGDEACHLQLDDFYHDRSHLPLEERARVNYDIPDAIDWTWAGRTLRDCREGRSTPLPSYDFATHCRTSGRAIWRPRPIVFVDGLWLLRPPEIRALFSLKVFLDTPTALRFSRRLGRDVAERGYTPEAVEHRLRTAVAPMHERYVEPQKQWADLVLAQPFEPAQLAELAERLREISDRSTASKRAGDSAVFRRELMALLSHHEYCH